MGRGGADRLLQRGLLGAARIRQHKLPLWLAAARRGEQLICAMGKMFIFPFSLSFSPVFLLPSKTVLIFRLIFTPFSIVSLTLLRNYLFTPFSPHPVFSVSPCNFKSIGRINSSRSRFDARTFSSLEHSWRISDTLLIGKVDTGYIKTDFIFKKEGIAKVNCRFSCRHKDLLWQRNMRCISKQGAKGFKINLTQPVTHSTVQKQQFFSPNFQ